MDGLAVCHARNLAQILDARIGARADEHAIDRDIADLLAALQPHIGERTLRGLHACLSSAIVCGFGTRPVIDDHLLRIGAPGDERRQRADIEPDLAVEFGTRRRSAAFPNSAWPRPTPRRCGDFGRSFRYAKVFSSGAMMPVRAPASTDMLQMVMRPSIESARTASPANSTAWPIAPAAPISPMRER